MNHYPRPSDQADNHQIFYNTPNHLLHLSFSHVSMIPSTDAQAGRALHHLPTTSSTSSETFHGFPLTAQWSTVLGTDAHTVQSSTAPSHLLPTPISPIDINNTTPHHHEPPATQRSYHDVERHQSSRTPSYEMPAPVRTDSGSSMSNASRDFHYSSPKGASADGFSSFGQYRPPNATTALDYDQRHKLSEDLLKRFERRWDAVPVPRPSTSAAVSNPAHIQALSVARSTHDHYGTVQYQHVSGFRCNLCDSKRADGLSCTCNRTRYQLTNLRLSTLALPRSRADTTNPWS